MGKKSKVLSFIFLDLILVFLSWFLGMRLLKSDRIFQVIVQQWKWLLGAGAFAVGVNAICKLYTGIWRFASFADALKCMGSALMYCCYALIVSFVCDAGQLTQEWAIVSSFIYFIALIASRF